MSSLRRDLIERKLWLAVAILVVAIAATPMLMKSKARAVSTLPPAPRPAPSSQVTTGTPVSTSRGSGVASEVKALAAKLARDPFASGVPHLQSKPSFQGGGASGSPASSGTASTSVVTPSPAAGGSGTATTSASTAPTSSGNSSAPASTSSAPATPTTPSTTPPASAGTPSATQPAPTAVGPWTIYSIDVRVGSVEDTHLRSDIPRLEPLPSAIQPAAMYMGILGGGKQAVFNLAAGVTPTGPGRCLPNHDQCAAIVLGVGQSEQLTTWPRTTARLLTLRVVAIHKTVTQSSQTALAAYLRHSATGLCELALADPVLYNLGKGTLTVAGALCRKQRYVVPFPGPQGAL